MMRGSVHAPPSSQRGTSITGFAVPHTPLSPPHCLPWSPNLHTQAHHPPSAHARRPAHSRRWRSTAVVVQAAAQQGVSKARRELWAGSKHVRAVSAEEAESMYMALCERTNDHHVMLVIYTPGCPQCKQMESEVEHLAEGLSHVKSLSVCALNIENDDVARYFAKEVLGLKFVPSVVLFPKHSRTYYKFKGKAHSSEHLLRFLNMVCNQHDDKVWTLSNAGKATSTVGAQQSSGVLSNQNSAGLAAAGALALVLAATGFAVRKRAAELQNPDVTVAAVDSQDGGYRDIVRSIDASITRMASLMLKLVGARIGLSVEQMRNSVPGYQVMLGGQQQGTQAALAMPPSSPQQPTAAPSPPQPSAPAPASSSAPSSSTPAPGSSQAAGASPWQTPSPPSSTDRSSSSNLVAAAAAARAQVAARSKAAEEAAARQRQLGQQQQGQGQGGTEALVNAVVQQQQQQQGKPVDEAAITGETVTARGLDASTIMRLLDEEGRDVSKVVERLNRDQSQFQITKR